eukprot:CAMPEP_0197438816 /NCGR_PEP_ID=MMETSP1175-20131217/5709_1 /TAXON_ID=1003142 /ORGANISM="Triceratium dubium, Strain CCMP147" /LENGTH=75 /DNA_ID=CAMNT_0042968617 /DNA_START=174 /DNA_END=402 /DNA_ORIENTATION=+
MTVRGKGRPWRKNEPRPLAEGGGALLADRDLSLRASDVDSLALANSPPLDLYGPTDRPSPKGLSPTPLARDLRVA